MEVPIHIPNRTLQTTPNFTLLPPSHPSDHTPSHTPTNHTLQTTPPLTSYLRAFCTSNPATTPMVVGREAAHTPSLFRVFSSMPEATTNGGAHCKGVNVQVNTCACKQSRPHTRRRVVCNTLNSSKISVN